MSPGAENLEPGWVQQKAEESTRAGMTTTIAPEPAHRTGSSSGSPRSPGEQATRFSTGAPLSRSVGFLLAGGKRQSSFVLNPGPALFAVVLEALHPLWEMPAHPLNGTVAHACPQPHWTGYRISTQDTSFANPSPVERASQGAGVKNPAVKAGNAGLIPGSGRSPGGGNGNILQYSCLGNPTDREACWATVHRVKKRVRHDLVTKIATENNNPNGKGRCHLPGRGGYPDVGLCSWLVQFGSVQFISVTQSCLTLCNPMNHSTPDLPVHHQLP